MSLQSELDEVCRAYNLPGLAVALVDGAASPHSTHLFTSGHADREQGITVDQTIRFRTGSSTKLLTCIAALQLQERGLLHLDEPASRLLPELEAGNGICNTNFRGVTLRHCLAHASGLPRGPYRSAPWNEPDLLQCLRSCVPVSEPGNLRKYSNLGFAAAAIALGRAADQSLGTWCEREIFRPLGMARASIDTTSTAGTPGSTSTLGARAPGSAIGYQTDHYRSPVWAGSPLQPAGPVAEMPGAGGFLASGMDLGLLLRAVLDHDQRLLKEASWSELQTVQPPLGSAPFGLGLRIGDRWGRNHLWHSGGAAGFSTFWSICPEAGVAAGAMTNRCGADVVLSRLLDTLLRPRLPPPGQRPPSKPLRLTTLPPKWHRYTGRYETSGHELQLAREGSRLVLRIDGEAVPLLPWGRHRFLQEGGPWQPYLLWFRVEQGLVFEGFAGPHHLVRDNPFSDIFRHGAKARTGRSPAREWACAGTYEHPTVGPVEVYHRRSGLTFSFFFGEETELAPVGRNRFRIRGGTFAGEGARFCFSGGRPVALEAGLLRFERRNTSPEISPGEW